MRQLEDSASEALTVLTALEALARLAWNDDDVREQIAQMDGIACFGLTFDITTSWSSGVQRG